MMSFSFIHAVTNGRISFFIQSIDILLYDNTTFYFPIHLLKDILVCFHILAIVNSGGRNEGAHGEILIKGYKIHLIQDE